jgi:hypothetical protein
VGDRRAIALLLALAALGTGGCGAEEARPRQAPAQDTVTLARAARLSDQARDAVLLAMEDVGRLRVGCDASGRTRITFVSDLRLPTADVTVAQGQRTRAKVLNPRRRFEPFAPAARPVVQLWRIAPFAKAQARVATITVAARPLPRGQAYSCAVSAQAAITLTDGTLTG